MPFVKLDCALLDSTLWVDRPAREVFLTALLMGEPYTLESDEKEIETRTLERTDFIVPAGKYGFVRAAGTGIGRRAGLDDKDEVLDALERLASPEADSRSPEFDGRRLVRINGGFIILNWEKYRRKDHTAAERQRRHRERNPKPGKSNAVTSHHNTVTSREVTEGEGEGRGERGEGDIGERVIAGKEGNNIPTPSTLKKNLPVKRDQHAVNKFIQSLSESSWAKGRARKEAWVAFGFFRWRNGIKQRVLFHKQRESRTIDLIEAYGLVRVLLAIEGQRTHPDFNDVHGKNFRGYDNLFRVGKGFENIEKCSAEAIDHARYEWTLKQLVGLGEKRGWTPGPLDVELFNQIRGTHE